MSIEKILILMALAWLSGVFFGMGIEQKLLAPRRHKKKCPQSDSGSPEPLPVVNVKFGQRLETASQERPLYIRHENNRAVYVIVRVNDFSVPPIFNSLKHENPND
jgi:hypothetical protein